MAGFLLFQWGFALNKSSSFIFSIKGSEMHVALDLKKMSTIQNNKTNTLTYEQSFKCSGTLRRIDIFSA